jgi:hypothetical protein
MRVRLPIQKKQGLAVAGIDLPRNLKKRITRKGIQGITPIEREQVFSTHLSDAVYKAYMFSIKNILFFCGQSG